ncbi:2-oxo-tetronate isomerase [Vibrio maritimus]|uniref:2-oxo-tetronate isomerase n=1 Tax=Vibrio maritimus TaxID=990268 RepID=UPI0037358FB3
MLNFAANLTTLFTERPFLDRFGAAADAGFNQVEFLFPYEFEVDAIKRRIEKYNLTVALINAPAGDWEAGERGLAAIRGKEEAFRQSVLMAEHYANALNVPRVHIMSGIKPENSSVLFDDNLFIENIRWAAEHLASNDIDVLLEPLNTYDNPGYYLSDYQKALSLISKVEHPAVKLQFDTYHAQLISGNLSRKLSDWISIIGHIQIASVPERHEPRDGEINHAHIFTLLQNLNYEGSIGCEYHPRDNTESGLGWITPYLNNTPSTTHKEG